MKFFCLNGNFIPFSNNALANATKDLDIEQSVFETIRVIRGHIPLMQYHQLRIKNSMAYFNSSFSEEALEKIFADSINLCNKNNQSEQARVRVNIFYEQGKEPSGYLIETFETLPLSIDIFEKDFKIDGYYLQSDKKSHVFKSKSKVQNIDAANWAKNNGLDDCFICTNDGEIIETSIANVFVLKNEVLYTTNEGVAGVMKTYLIDQLKKDGIQVITQNIYIEFLLASQEIFLSNALRGVIPIVKFQNNKFDTRFSKIIFQKYIAPIYI